MLNLISRYIGVGNQRCFGKKATREEVDYLFLLEGVAEHRRPLTTYVVSFSSLTNVSLTRQPT
jgi:hypothetical protein